MRVLIAPDKFAGTLSAVEAANAIADGWSRRASEDDLTLAPMADGGPGFVDVLHAALGGELRVVTVRGPLGDAVPVTMLVTDRDAGDRTVYLESSQACGLHLVAADRRDPESATTVGVGEALIAALDLSPGRIVVGLGGSATNDAGAGMLATLGATADGPLDRGPRHLAGVGSVAVDAARQRFEGVELVLASDVDNVLLGMFGATNAFGAQKGLEDDARQRVDRVLDGFVDAVCGSSPAERRVADAAGSGAAGGLGFALLLLDGTRCSGIALVIEATGLAGRTAEHDVVVTGEGAYDFSSGSGKVVHGVAQLATQAVRPCVVLAGQVLVGSREMRAMGIEAAYSVVELVGEHAALEDPYASLRQLASRVARTWSF